MARSRKKQTLNLDLKHISMLVGVLVVFAVLFIGNHQLSQRHVSNIHIQIEELQGNKPLVTEKEVYELLEIYTGFDVERAAMKDFDILSLEAKLNKDKRIKSANVYFGKRGHLYIEIDQRDPIVRVDVTGGQDYYLDKEGKAIPVSTKRILRLPIATGQIDAYANGYLEDANHSLNDVFTIANQIDEDEFLKALVEQIHVEQDGSLVLVPKLGRNKIILGTSLAMEAKLSKLKLYYKEGIKRVGLDRFAEINLSYEGQIVGVK